MKQKNRFSEKWNAFRAKPQYVYAQRAVCLLLMAALTAGAVAYAQQKFDLSFVTRPTAPGAQDNTQNSTAPDQPLSPAEEAEHWTSMHLEVDQTGALADLQEFLRQLPDHAGAATAEIFSSDSMTLIPLTLSVAENQAYSLSEEAYRDVQLSALPEVRGDAYETVISDATRPRPRLKSVGGYIVSDRGDGTYDLLDTSGNAVLRALSYEQVSPTVLTDAAGNPVFTENGGYTVMRDGKRVAVDAAETMQLVNRSMCVEKTGAVQDGTSIYSVNGKFGYLAANGTHLTDAVFTRAFAFSEGYAVALDETDLYIIRSDGTVLYNESYAREDDIEAKQSLILPTTEGTESLGHFYFDHGMLRIRRRIHYTPHEGYYYNNYYTFDGDILINAYGVSSAPPNGYRLVWYHDGIRVLQNKSTGAWGLMNAVGEWITPPQFEDARSTVQGLTPVRYNGKWGLVDQTGAFVLPAAFDNPPTVSGGLICAHSAEDGWLILQICEQE